MYQALYRKWRPRTFDDVVGQEHVVSTLRSELALGKLAHAYLFTGSRGTGKTTLAKIFAKAVNCLHPTEAGPCLACEICRGIDDGTVLDVVEQDAASNNGVDYIRALREETSFTPVSAAYRVYILDEVHMLSIGAVNALLKIMEEPPPHVIFILATTEVQKIPETLLSRCQRFDFRRLTQEQIVGRLNVIAAAEGARLLPGAGERIASLVNGGMRDAIGLLDQAMAVSPEISAENVDLVAGVAGRDHLFRLTEAVRTAGAEEIFAVIDELYERSFDVDRLCGDLHTWFRDLMLVKTCRDAARFVSVPSDLPRLTAQAEGFTLPAIFHAMSALQQAQLSLTRVSSARSLLETTLLKLTDPRLDDSPEALLRRLEAVEARLTQGVHVRGPQPLSPQPSAPEERPSVSVQPPYTRPPAPRQMPAPASSVPAPQPAPYPAVPGPVPQPAGSVPSEPQREAGAEPSPAAPRSEGETSGTGVPDGQASLFAPDDTPRGNAPAEPQAGPVPAPPSSPRTALSGSAFREIAQASAQASPIPDGEWSEIVAAVGQTNQPLCGALFGSKGYVSGQRVLISGSDFFLRMIREDPGAKKSLKAVLAAHYGQSFGIGPYTAAPKETPQDRFDRLASTAASMGIALEEDGASPESIL